MVGVSDGSIAIAKSRLLFTTAVKPVAGCRSTEVQVTNDKMQENLKQWEKFLENKGESVQGKPMYC
jgi:hypothetical protein